jgi:hypothetical protein
MSVSRPPNSTLVAPVSTWLAKIDSHGASGRPARKREPYTTRVRPERIGRTNSAI